MLVFRKTSCTYWMNDLYRTVLNGTVGGIQILIINLKGRVYLSASYRYFKILPSCLHEVSMETPASSVYFYFTTWSIATNLQYVKFKRKLGSDKNILRGSNVWVHKSLILKFKFHPYIVIGIKVMIKKLQSLTLLWRMSLSYRNQFTDLPCKWMHWFLYDMDLRHERVNSFLASAPILYPLKTSTWPT